MGEKIDFNDYINLFNCGRPIREMSPLNNQTYKVFMMSNIDIRVIDRETCIAKLCRCSQLERFTADTKTRSRRYFYVIPIQTPSGDYVGFVYRALFDHGYMSVLRPFNDISKKVPYMFGFYKDFETYNLYTDRAKTCMPIVVCEGAKDAIMLKSLYPYVVSNNTSSLGLNAYVISNITDKVLLAYDNDETGHEQSPKDKSILTNLGCSVDILKYDKGFKDAADYFNHPTELKALKRQMTQRIKGLINGVTLAL